MNAPERFDADWLRSQLTARLGPLRAQRFCVAYSGGLDSTALLAAMAAARARGRFGLRAVHVNHGLQPAAPAWARAARRQARALAVPCAQIVLRIGPSRGESLEALARTARYRALVGQLRPGEVLVTAHHQEDQLETVLLALLRGSGLNGLAGMRFAGAWEGAPLLRPLLPVSRAQLEHYARASGLRWIDDPSNLDRRFDRNYLRHEVLPVLLRRWPAAAATAGRSAAHLAEARGLLDRLARDTLEAARDGTTLCAGVLRRLDEPRRRAVLRAWLLERGLPLPDSTRLLELAGPLLRARADAVPAVRWPGAEVRCFDERLWALPLTAGVPVRERRRGAATVPAGSGFMPERVWDWRRRAALMLPQGGTLRLTRDRHGDLDLDALPAPLTVRFRTGGERLRDTHGTLELKELLQRCVVPPWRRDAVPLLFDRDGRRILAVADLWIAPEYRAGAASPAASAARSRRGRLCWRPGGACDDLD